MLFSTFATLFAAALVSGAPAELVSLKARSWTSSLEELKNPSNFDHGDGFYWASFKDGVAHVEFTPFDEANASAPKPLTARGDDDTVSILAGTTCNGQNTYDVNNLDEANRQLARNGNGRTYGPHEWGWVHRGTDTSYFCNYQTNYLWYDLIIEMHTVVSNVCGQWGYGFDRRTHGGGANDFAVGRVRRGESFCDGYYHE